MIRASLKESHECIKGGWKQFQVVICEQAKTLPHLLTIILHFKIIGEENKQRHHQSKIVTLAKSQLYPK